MRGTSLAACMSAFGALVFAALILPAPELLRAPELPRALRRLIIGSLCAALLLNLTWLALQTIAMADADTIEDALAALPVVAFDTSFGHVILGRVALLVATLLLLRLRTLVPALLTSAASVVLQAGVAHATARFATDGPALLISETLHLSAAGAWLGSLLPLAITVSALPSPAVARICRAFSPLGMACVLVIAGTGLLQGAELVGGIGHLTDTRYGRLALLKLMCFFALLVVASMNRFVLAAHPRALKVNLSMEILLGVVVVGVAAQLASTAPVTP